MIHSRIYAQFFTLLFKSCGLTLDLSLTLAFVFNASAVLAAFKRGVGSFKACKDIHKNTIVIRYMEHTVTTTYQQTQ